MLGSLILYLKGMRRMMFQLSGFYCKSQHLTGNLCRGVGPALLGNAWPRGNGGTQRPLLCWSLCLAQRVLGTAMGDTSPNHNSNS